MKAFVCERLAGHHDRQAFQCGTAELDEYLRNRARQDAQRRVAAVYVMTPESERRRIAGFYTLSATSVLLDALPPELRRKLPRYPVVPAILLGRLARDSKFPGIGGQLLSDALARALSFSHDVAAAAVLVDAKSQATRRFYARYGFEQVPHAPDRLFLPMKTIERLFGTP